MRSASRFRWSIRAAALVLGSVAFSVAVAAAATPVSGFVSGQILSVKTASFVVKDTFGSVSESTVTLSKSSSIIEQVTAAKSELKKGACVSAMGQKASSGEVDASRITISAPVKGSCSTGFAGRGGGRPSGTPPAGAPSGSGGSSGPGGGGGFGGFGNFGFAFGSVTAVDGSTLTVKGQSGATKVAVSGSTSLLEMKDVDRSEIQVNDCANVRGTSSDNGKTVAATSVNLSKPSSNGCGFGFGGPR